ncbi:glycosylphosphatidylinositol specific phospholipase D1 [Capsaspora owczarzaki ATCC 30864]|uniref:Phosphatidylinositol-glycan-specific phospholipase D n=1 Tax=Capsaspora owczarzaki (strain ATCC 30864) TaxID=595528 RepID=A0A0D2X361_CAPO3|nr:glycosylphosphatidylinositol specific phospholipase D1 [Capsaspora owczarzaki ATCC 30864]KJE93749.1 glycosylphosphatidylinositol specific phospholipase D1 [Capsaspora owczarzaki ATCC 30864]KJE93750.1 glycosylphosphatidylinositol specific phospholipase D1, variant [Capsaspora owczarzaki ATCC 30864]|eukprot:XP_004348326.1 glycosylphosphatidylinositol specific phospholipase D1 [Capsaspora owczarzaki ATCC 30864]
MTTTLVVRALLVLCVAVVAVQGCGISTHITIARYALDFFDPVEHEDYKQIALKHQDAFQAGNPYPDAYYNSLCFKGNFGYVSEDTHWTPFMNATANYIRSAYPRPWSEAAEKLVAFYLGFVSHEVADISWHALGIPQGFLSTMGNENFHGSFSAAHSVGDEGGDVVANYELQLKFISEIGKWYIPVQDLLKIYTQLYGVNPINATVVEECTAWLFLGRLGERLAVAKAFPSYSKKSPFLVESFMEFFLGGVYDMAAWTQLIWNNASIPMVERGTQTCDLNNNPMLVRCAAADAHDVPKSPKMPQQANRRACANSQGFGERLQRVIEPRKLSLSDIKISRTADGGAYLEPSVEVKEALREVEAIILAAKEEELARRETARQAKAEALGAPASGLFTTSTNHSRVGWAMASGDFNNDGIADVAVGAPGTGEAGNAQHGRVYIVYGAKGDLHNVDLNAAANLIIDGQDLYGRFGSALAVVDLNADGVDDLAVGAPSVGAGDIMYTGKVFVFYGKKGSTLSTTAGTVISGQDTYHNLGWRLAGGDLDSDARADLVVGAPYAPAGGNQRGAVYVFRASANHGQQVESLTVANADWTMTGEMDNAWFGYHVSVERSSPETNSTGVLLVGAPSTRICASSGCSFSDSDVQSVGKIFGFAPAQSASNPIFTLAGVQSFGKLGLSAAIGSPLGSFSEPHLIVGAPTQTVEGKIAGIADSLDQAGAVYMIRLADLLGKAQTLNQVTPALTLGGDRRYARFGWHVVVADVNDDQVDDVLISAPTRTDDVSEELLAGEEGIVYVFHGGAKFPTGNATSHDCGLLPLYEPCPGHVASTVFQPNEADSRFGAAFIAADVDGDGKRNVIVGAERSHQGSYLGGTVEVFLKD